MEVVRLPVTGTAVGVREPGGAEDVVLAEATRRDTRLAVELLARVVSSGDGAGAIEWRAMPATDVAAAVMHVRRVTIGDTIRTTVECPECGKPIDVSFGIGSFLEHHEARVPKGVEGADDSWFRFAGSAFRFRAPTAGDRADADLDADPVRALAERCIPRATAADRRRAERALASIAPALATELDARCPECETSFAVWFDAQEYCLEELAGAASEVFAEVHLLAGRYGWPEADILALPRARRTRYAEMIRDERRPA